MTRKQAPISGGHQSTIVRSLTLPQTRRVSVQFGLQSFDWSVATAAWGILQEVVEVALRAFAVWASPATRCRFDLMASAAEAASLGEAAFAIPYDVLRSCIHSPNSETLAKSKKNWEKRHLVELISNTSKNTPRRFVPSAIASACSPAPKVLVRDRQPALSSAGSQH